MVDGRWLFMIEAVLDVHVLDHGVALSVRPSTIDHRPSTIDHRPSTSSVLSFAIKGINK